MKVIALLPMKGNSERVPNKNLKDFNGKPLFYWVAKSLDDSNLISQVIVNTDSKKIEKEVLKEFPHFKIHHRPISIQGDFVSMNDIIEYDIENSDGELYLQTHSTNPLLKSKTINEAINYFIENKKSMDSLFSVTKVQTRFYTENGEPANHDPSELLRTQDLPIYYEENSNIYLFDKRGFFANEKKRIGQKPCLFNMDKVEAIDIDEPEDFEIAQAIHRLSF